MAKNILMNNNSKTKTIIDFGCADGYALPLFSSISKRVIAVDIDRAMLDLAKRKCSHLSNVDFVHIDDFDFTGDIFVALEVFDHINNVPFTLDIARRFLTNKDRLMVISLPLEIGPTKLVKLMYGWIFFRKNILHFRRGYDFRPLLKVLHESGRFVVDRTYFEPFKVMGKIVNRGVFFTIRLAQQPLD